MVVRVQRTGPSHDQRVLIVGSSRFELRNPISGTQAKMGIRAGCLNLHLLRGRLRIKWRFICTPDHEFGASSGYFMPPPRGAIKSIVCPNSL